MDILLLSLIQKDFFKKDALEVSFKTVGISKEAVKSMGGLTIVPDCVIDENSVLLLPGSDVWSEPEHLEIINTAYELISCEGSVCAICGATVALAHAGILDNRPHTINVEVFLLMFCPTYKVKYLYVV